VLIQKMKRSFTLALESKCPFFVLFSKKCESVLFLSLSSYRPKASVPFLVSYKQNCPKSRRTLGGHKKTGVSVQSYRVEINRC